MSLLNAQSTSVETAALRDIVDALDGASSAQTMVNGSSFTLDASLVKQVGELLSGNTESLLPETISTGQAADLLGVSRPTVVALIDDGKLPAERLNSHRRLNTVDVLAYRDASRVAQKHALDEHARLGAEMGLLKP